MKINPEISIIIPCYNSSKTIARTIKSLEVSIESDAEILFVDDGSTDNTVSEIERLSKKLNYRIISKANGGVSSARNVGIDEASGKYIYFLDSDDTIAPELLSRIKSNDSDMIIFGYRHQKNNRWKAVIPRIRDNYVSSYLLGEIYINMCSFAVKRAIVTNTGIKFDEHTYYSEDIEFIVRCLYASKQFKIIPECLFHYHNNPESVMHHPVYNEKRISSINAYKRLTVLLEKELSLYRIIYMRLQLEVFLQIRDYHRMCCTDIVLLNKIEANNTVFDIDTGIKPNRYWAYVYLMRKLYKHNKRIFHLLIKAI